MELPHQSWTLRRNTARSLETSKLRGNQTFANAKVNNTHDARPRQRKRQLLKLLSWHLVDETWKIYPTLDSRIICNVSENQNSLYNVNGWIIGILRRHLNEPKLYKRTPRKFERYWVDYVDSIFEMPKDIYRRCNKVWNECGVRTRINSQSATGFHVFVSQTVTFFWEEGKIQKTNKQKTSLLIYLLIYLSRCSK